MVEGDQPAVAVPTFSHGSIRHAEKQGDRTIRRLTLAVGPALPARFRRFENLRTNRLQTARLQEFLKRALFLQHIVMVKLGVNENNPVAFQISRRRPGLTGGKKWRAALLQSLHQPPGLLLGAAMLGVNVEQPALLLV